MGKCVGGKLNGIISCFNKHSGHQIDTRMIKIGNDFKNNLNSIIRFIKITGKNSCITRSKSGSFLFFTSDNGYVRVRR